MTANLKRHTGFYPKVLGIGVLLASSPPAAYGLDESASQGTEAASAGGKEEAENTGTDFTRPVNSLEFRFQYRPSSAPGSETEKEYAILRATTRIDLDEAWKVSLYAHYSNHLS